MNCNDNSYLKIPLPELCDRPDLGCIPETSGMPDWTPRDDQLPFAYDIENETLWMFVCETKKWESLRKFRLCDLQELSLENINNICTILQIPVFFDPGNGCMEGSISLSELAEELIKCVNTGTEDFRAICVNATTLRLEIIDYNSGVHPLYFTFENLRVVCGTGEEGDPIQIIANDPICEWPTQSQAQVDQAVEDGKPVHLGACIDGEEARIPLPPKPCEFPALNQDQVDESTDKQLIACVDDANVKVPFPPQPCSFPSINQDAVDNAASKELIACVDNENVKVPFPADPCEFPNITQDAVDSAVTKALIACVDDTNVKVPFPVDPCAYPVVTQPQVDATNNKHIIACVDDNNVKIPVPPGFFNDCLEYICVPMVTVKPTEPPAHCTGPLRVGCCGELWVWVCDQNEWVLAGMNPGNYPKLSETSINNICENLRFIGWYDNQTDPCLEQVQLTLSELANRVADCIDICCPTVAHIAGKAGGGACISLNLTDEISVIRSRDTSVVRGPATLEPASQQGTPIYNRLDVTNPFDEVSLLDVELHALAEISHSNTAQGSFIFVISDVLNEAMPTFPQLSYTSSIGILNVGEEFGIFWPEAVYFTRGQFTQVARYRRVLQAGESISLYTQYWSVLKGTIQSELGVVIHGSMVIDANIYRGVV